MNTMSWGRTSAGCICHPQISDFEIPTPAHLLETPGMLSISERKFLYSLAKSKYKAQGFVIDAGSFMGSSVVALAQGLTENPYLKNPGSNWLEGEKPIHSYELGYLPAPANGADVVRHFDHVRYKFGDSFVPTLKDNIAPYTELINLNIGDFNTFTWPKRAIEICFVDVCKTPALNRHVTQQFMPNLLPDSSFFINQDFFFDRLPWIKITMGYLAEYFEWYGQVFTTSIYKCTKKIPDHIVEYDPFTQASLDECLKYHDCYANQHLEDMFQLRMEISKAYLLGEKGNAVDALDHLDAVGKTFEHTFHDEGLRGMHNKNRYDRAVRQIKRKFQ
ncbi:hypothetical protein [Microbulbifer sp. 2205BS26-8]|uniref:hypothetical protein n=1 Tax=Microbulbifer sp. 2205BS26-8 TaxID=3064386 RepID=UPI00273EA17A|nr:hypothetical protein [Microbulbifer sp. 2205BS26-8]MDP5210898.1 hypothetical protein [Microbulbifer sp. 2205BS26-8]